MPARTGTGPALRRRGSVVTPAKGRDLADGFLGWGRLAGLARIRVLPAGTWTEMVA